ncbi:MAG: hypothetical protein GF400_06725 [Candidatus Eisenbacteria bacterium]|nr:hypothetical protein [Candidatus Eisenbacteria bacterium]
MKSLLLVLLGISISAAAMADPTVFVSPGHAFAVEGDTFEIDVRVDAGTDTVTCFLVEFTFDPQILELLSADEGSLFTNCGYETMYDWDVYGDGWHSCNDVTLGYWAYAVCPGELIDLKFEAVSWGETCIEITAVDLRDLDRNPIPNISTSDGLVTVAPATGVDEGVAEPHPSIAFAPNPFGRSVRISLEGAQIAGEVQFRIYDAAGREVARRVAGGRPARASGSSGDGETDEAVVYWDGLDRTGAELPSGVYFVVARGRGWERTGRVVHLR